MTMQKSLSNQTIIILLLWFDGFSFMADGFHSACQVMKVKLSPASLSLRPELFLYTNI